MLGRESNSAEAKTVSKLCFLPALRGFSVMRADERRMCAAGRTRNCSEMDGA